LDSNGKEAKCFESGTARMYKYFKKEAPFSSSSSSRKKRDLFNFNHWFVEYRGFVYEFGSYGFQELDINDPNYKYGPGREKVVDQEYMGTSRCTRDQLMRFINKWLEANPNYNVVANNCQDFAKAVLRELEKNCPNRVRRQDEDKESFESSVSHQFCRLVVYLRL